MKRSFKRVAWNLSVCLTMLATLMAGPFRAYGAPVTWNGSIDALWNTPANWTGGIPTNTSDVTFPAVVPATGSTITLGAGEVANSLSFLNSYTLTGGSVALASGSVFTDFLTYDTISSQLTGGNGLTKTGYGTLYLNNPLNNNSYTGTTTVNLGSVVFNNPSALGASATTVVVNGNQTRGSGGGQIVAAGGVNGMTFTRGVTVNGGGPDADGVSFVSIGNNTFSGAVGTGSASRLAATFGTTTLSGPINLASGATSQFLGSGNWNLTGAIALPTATSILEKTGVSGTSSGTMIVAGTNNFLGELRASSGFIRLANGTGVGIVSPNGGTFELRSDAINSYSATKLTFRASSSTFVDHAIGSGAINQQITFGDTSLASSNTTQTIIGRNGTGLTLTGIGGPTGNITLATGNPTTFTNSSNGLLTFNGNISSTDGTSRTFTFGGNGDSQINGNLLLTGGTHNVTKAGTGTLTLFSTDSTYGGNTNVSAGTLAIHTFGGINDVAGRLNIGNGTTTGATFNYLGAVGTGAGETVTKAVNINVTSGANAVFLANQTGSAPTALTLTNIIATQAGASQTANTKFFVLGGSNTLDNTVSGVIPDSSATQVIDASASGLNNVFVAGTTTLTMNSVGNLGVGAIVSGPGIAPGTTITAVNTTNVTITLSNPTTADINDNDTLSFTGVVGLGKIGKGTWLLNAANTYTGNTFISGGRLKLQDLTGTTNVVTDTSNFSFTTDTLTQMAGGALEYIGFTSGGTEQLGTLTNTSGGNTVRVTPGASGTTALRFTGPLSVANGTSLNFDVPTGSTVTVAGQAAGFINAHAYFNSSNFAFSDATTPGLLRAPIYGTDTNFVTSATALTSGRHMQITGNAASGAVTINSLRINGSRTLNMTGLLTINTGANTPGGILQTGGTGAITGTGVTTGGSGDLVVRVDGLADQLTLNAPITSTTTGGLTKNGAGTLVLASASNAQTGTTTINEGTIKLSGTGRISAANAALTIRQGGTLDLNGVATGTAIGALNGAGTITNTAASGTAILTVGNNNTSGYWTGAMNDGPTAKLALTKVGTGTFSLNAAETFTGPVTLTAGTLAVTTLADFGTASGIGAGGVAPAATDAINAAALVFNGGTLQYTGANGTIFQPTETPSVSINRLFTMAAAGTIDSSGNFGNNGLTANANNATLIFNNAGNIAFSGTGTRVLTLTGNSTGDNAINLHLIDNGSSANNLGITKAGTGLWLLTNATNAYTGFTTITAGALQAQTGSTLPTNSPLVLNGGVFQTSGTFTRNLVTTATVNTANQVSFTGAGGFAASTSKLTLNFGGAAAALTWGTGGFVTSGNLILGSTTALSEVELVNPINLGSATRTIQTDDNTTTTTDIAILSGVLSGTAAAGTNALVKTGAGWLELLGANTYTGNTNLQNGLTFATSLGNSTAGSLTPTTFGIAGQGSIGSLLLGSGGNTVFLNYVGAGEVTDRPIILSGSTGNIVIDNSGSGPLTFTNISRNGAGAGAGNMTLSLRGFNTDANTINSVLTNDAAGTGVLTVTKDTGNTWILNAQNTYTGNTNDSSGLLGLGVDSVGAPGSLTSGPVGIGTLVIGNASLFAANGDRVIGNNVTFSNNTNSVMFGQNSLTFDGVNTIATGNNTNTLTNNLPAGKVWTINGTFTHADQTTTDSKTALFNGSGATVINGQILQPLPTSTTSTGTANFNVTYAGTGSLTLGNTLNNYIGSTTLTSGTLKLGASDVIPDGAGFGNVTINPAAGVTATLDLNGKAETVNGITATTAGIGVINNTAATPVTFTFGGNNANVNIAPTGTGSFQIKNTGGGALSLTKIGSGTATLSAATALTYTGATNVNGGTLNVNATLNGSKSLTASGGGTLRVTTPLATPNLFSVTGTGSSMVLSGALNLTGNTSIVATGVGSTLTLSGALNTPDALTSINVGGGGSLNLVNAAGIPLINLAAFSLGVGGTSTLNIELGSDSGVSDVFSLLNAANFGANEVTFNLFALSGYGAGSYDLISAPSGLLSHGTTYKIGRAPSGFSYSFENSDELIQIQLTPITIPDPLYWRGAVSNSWASIAGNGDTNFTTDLAGTLNSQVIPGSLSTVIFSANGTPGPTINTTLDGSLALNALQFTANPSPVTTVSIGSGTGGSLTIAPLLEADGISVAANAGNVTISAPVVLGSNQTWNVVGTGASSLALTGGISGPGAITKTGAGTATVSGGFDTWTADTITLLGGTLSLKSNGTGNGVAVPVGTSNGNRGPILVIDGSSTLDVGNTGANQGNTITFNDLNIRAGATTVTFSGTTAVTGATTGPASYNVAFLGNTSIDDNLTIRLGTSNTVATQVSLVGQVNSISNVITLTGAATPAPHAVLRVLNTRSGGVSNAISGTWNVTAGGNLEAHVGAGGSENGNSSMGTATIALNGGQLKVAPNIGTSFGTLTAGADAGFTARFYQVNPGTAAAINFLNTPFDVSVIPTINSPGNLNGVAPAGIGTTGVSAVFSGILNIATAGIYGFNSPSDDGSIISIDGSMVVNNDNGHVVNGQLPWGSIYLNAGPHVFTQRYYQNTATSGVVASYVGPDTGNSVVLVGSIADSVFTNVSNVPTATISNAITFTGTSTIDIAVDTVAPALDHTTGNSTLNVTSSGFNPNGAGNGLNTLTATGAATLQGNVTFNTNNANLRFNAAVGSGAGFGFTKSGNGNLTLASAANSYSGATSINAGTLVFTANQNLAAATNNLNFGSANNVTTAGILDLTAASATFGGQFTVQTNTATPAFLNIGASRTLTVNNSVVVGTGASALTNTALGTIGGGTLTVANANAGGTFTVGGTTSAAAVGNRAIADFSGLGNLNIALNATNGVIRVNPTNTNAAAGRFSTLTLATNNTISGSALNVGDSAQLAGNGQVNSLLLGTGTNLIQVNAVNIGTGGADLGSIKFAGSTGTVTITSATSGPTPLNIGTGASTTAVVTTDVNTFDVTGHNATLNFGDVNLSTQAARAADLTSNFSFDTGTLSMATLTMSTRALATNVNTSTVNIGGGTTAIGTGTGTAITLASSSVAGGSAVANLNLTGGLTTITGDVIKGGGAGTAIANFKLDGGTLNMSGKSLGTVEAIDSLVFASGTAQNIGTINAVGANGGLVKTTTGTLVLAGNNLYTGPTDIRGGTLSAATDDLGAVPAAATPANVIINGATLAATNSFALNVKRGIALGDASALAGGTIDVAATRTLTVGGVVANNGAGTGSLTKTGTGVLTLTGANTYTGTTTVSGGTLLLNGTHTPANVGGYTVQSGAILAGLGATTAAINMADGATLTGGAIGSVGTLTTGDETWTSNTVLLVDATTLAHPDFFDTHLGGGITLTGTGASGTEYDRVNLGAWTGPSSDPAIVTLTGSGLVLPTQSGAAYYVIAHSSVANSFADVAHLSLDTSTLSFAPGTDTPALMQLVSLNNGQDLAIKLDSVPEPTSLALIATAVALGMGRRRRSSNRAA